VAVDERTLLETTTHVLPTSASRVRGDDE
jgi:hypothetical protein